VPALREELGNRSDIRIDDAPNFENVGALNTQISEANHHIREAPENFLLFAPDGGHMPIYCCKFLVFRPFTLAITPEAEPVRGNFPYLAAVYTALTITHSSSPNHRRRTSIRTVRRRQRDCAPRTALRFLRTMVQRACRNNVRIGGFRTGNRLWKFLKDLS
jgi:hypothetical protein